MPSLTILTRYKANEIVNAAEANDSDKEIKSEEADDADEVNEAIAVDEAVVADEFDKIDEISARLVIPAGILRIPVFSVPVALFSQESRFLFRRNFFGTPSGILSVWGLRRMIRRK